MVVTETATPTPALARVSSASIPAMPAASATTIVSLLTVASVPSTVEWMSNPAGISPKTSCSDVGQARRGRGERHPDQEGHERPRGEADDGGRPARRRPP